MKTDHDEWVVIWTDPSVEDVLELADYISRDSPRYASIVVHQIYDAGECLS